MSTQLIVIVCLSRQKTRPGREHTLPYDGGDGDDDDEKEEEEEGEEDNTKKMLQIFSNINSNRFPPPQHYHIFVGDLKHKKI